MDAHAAAEALHFLEAAVAEHAYHGTLGNPEDRGDLVDGEQTLDASRAIGTAAHRDSSASAAPPPASSMAACFASRRTNGISVSTRRRSAMASSPAGAERGSAEGMRPVCGGAERRRGANDRSRRMA